MAKVKKICAYKGCNPNDSNNETYFSFPSDPIRCQIWKDLCKTELPLPKYLCSKHFDRKKYISENPRRNILLHTAVPFPYEESDDNQKDITETNENLLELVEPIAIVEDQTLNLNDNIDFIEISDKSNDVNDTNIIEYNEKNAEKVPKSILVELYKRKSNILIPITEKIRKIHNIETVDPNLIISKNNSNYKVKPALDKTITTINNEETNANNSDTQVTTFIFKGEEYIQMPKSLYLKEKSDLEKKVQHYANIVYGIQNFLEKESQYKE